MEISIVDMLVSNIYLKHNNMNFILNLYAQQHISSNWYKEIGEPTNEIWIIKKIENCYAIYL